jgi:hypothetical protein
MVHKKPLALWALGFLPLILIAAKRDETGENKVRELVVEKALSHVGESGFEQYLPGTAATPSTRVHWCGIFALHILQEAGLALDWRWIYGKGFAFKLPMTRKPQAGDVAYIDKPYQHHAIVERVEGDRVHTIDGNQDGDIVSKRVRPLKDFSAFYSIGPLISSHALKL